MARLSSFEPTSIRESRPRLYDDPNVGIRLSPSIVSQGSTLTFTYRGEASPPTHVELQLAQIDRIATRWKLTTRLDVGPVPGGWVAQYEGIDLDIGMLYEAYLFVAPEVAGSSVERTLLETEEHLYFKVVDRPLNCDEIPIESLVLEVLEERQRHFDIPLGDADASAEFRAMVLIAGLKMTSRLRSPGLVIEPVPVGRGPVWDGAILNEVLASRGWGSVADLDAWSATRLSQNPVSLITIDRINADSPERAHAISTEWAEAALDVLALRRGARGSVVGAAVQQRGGRNELFEVAIAPHGDAYPGNLLGGFLSGEDPHGFVSDVAAVSSNPQVALVLSLFAEAEEERSTDLAYLKLWSLLELLANRLVAEGIELTDFTGNPLFAGDHRASTATPRGRVYELAKRHYQAGQISPTIRDRSMWEATAVWSGRRNAAAHYGRFHPDDTRQQSEWWYEVVLSSYESAQQAGGQVRFHDIDLQGLFEVTRIIVERELRGRPMALGDIG